MVNRSVCVKITPTPTLFMKITGSYFDAKFWHRMARSGGGLSCGIRIHFPVNIWDGQDEPQHNHKATNTRYKSIWIQMGFIFWELAFHIDYNFKPLE